MLFHSGLTFLRVPRNFLFISLTYTTNWSVDNYSNQQVLFYVSIYIYLCLCYICSPRSPALQLRWNSVHPLLVWDLAARQLPHQDPCQPSQRFSHTLPSRWDVACPSRRSRSQILIQFRRYIEYDLSVNSVPFKVWADRKFLSSKSTFHPPTAFQK